MKRIKLIPLVAAALLFTACASEPVVKPQQEYTDISLSWWGNDSRIEYTLDAVKRFEQLHPEIRVKCSYTEWSGYQTRFNIHMVSESESDVMLINFAWLDEYSADGNGFYDINTLSDYIDLSQFSEGELSFGLREGKLNAIPIAMNTQTVYFNKDIYDSYGLELPKTWDDLFTAAEVMKQDDIYPVAMASKGALFYIIAYTEQLTGKRFMTENGSLNFTKKDIAIMLDYYAQLVNAHVMPQNEYFDKNDIRSGKYAGVVAWLSDAKNMMESAENEGYTVVVGDYTSSIDEGSGWYTKPATMYAISHNTEHPAEAAMLLDFLLNSDEISELQGIEKGIPLSRKSRAYLEEHDMLKGLQYEAFEKMNCYLNKMMLIDPFMENGDVLDSFKAAWNEVLFEKATSEEAAEELYSSFNEMLLGS